VSEELKSLRKPARYVGRERVQTDMTNCDVMNALAASNIEAKSFDVLSSVSRLAAIARNRANVLRIANSLFRLNRSMTTFLDEIHAIMAGKKPAPQPHEQTSPEAMRTTADNLEHICRTIQYIVELSRRARLTNNSLTAGSLNSLSRRADELLDFADWLETIANPKEFKTAFERAKGERARGEVYELSQV
jgi:hypothetical protein